MILAEVLFFLAIVCVMTSVVIKYYRKRTTRVAYILAILAIPFLIVSLVIKWYPVTNYYTSPHFSQEAFQKIYPGMSPDEVRDLVGPPLERFHRESIDPETSLKSEYNIWEYSKPDRQYKPYKRFVVEFDQYNKVVETTDYETRFSKPVNAETDIEVRDNN